MIVTLAFDMFLSNRHYYLDVHDKKMDLGEIIFLGLCLLTLIAFLFVWIFYKTPTPPKTNPFNPQLVFSKYTKDLKGYDDPNFKIVDLDKLYQGSVPQGVYQENPLLSKS